MINARALILVTLLASTANAAPASVLPPAQPAEDQAGDGSAILGKWKLVDQALVVEIAKSGSGYAGTVVESPQGPALVGKVFLRGISYDAAHGEWRGEIYAPKRSEYVPMTAKRKGAGVLLMTAGNGIVSKELTWNRT